jgi:hypothetical protein
MTPDDVTSVLVEVRRLRARFADTAPQPWTATTAAAELTVQMGHLALCLLHRRQADTADTDDPQRPILNIGDELADVLLSALSVTTLADSDPADLEQAHPTTGDETDGFLRLLVSAGQLAEAAMVHDGYRHRPTGRPPSISSACARAVDSCDSVAAQLDLDLLGEFRAMVTDADTFLDGRPAPDAQSG